MKNKIAILLGVIFILCCVENFAFANEIEDNELYITENTTQWDIVERTNPESDEIPVEVREKMENSYIISQKSTLPIYMAVSAKVLIILCVCIILILGVMFLSSKKRKNE